MSEVERLRAKKKQIHHDLKDDVGREWVGLTKDEIDNMDLPDWSTREELVWIIEAKLKEKNT